jgi:gluconokinase
MIVILMGTAGSGKTTVGQLLADQLGWDFADADNFHSPENVAKMSRAIPLDDADRAAWLAALRAIIQKWLAESQNAVMACSALKASYREHLRVSPRVRFVYLKGSYETIERRIAARTHHYAPKELLASQFAALEEPGDDAITVDIDPPPETIVARIRQLLRLA